LDLQELIKELEKEEDQLNACSYDIASCSSYQITFRKVNRLTAMVEEAKKERLINGS
jgi:hypothetical protein